MIGGFWMLRPKNFVPNSRHGRLGSGLGWGPAVWGTRLEVESCLGFTVLGI